MVISPSAIEPTAIGEIARRSIQNNSIGKLDLIAGLRYQVVYFGLRNRIRTTDIASDGDLAI